jgi:hypothetical protein
VQLFFEVTLALAGQFREVRCQAVAVGVVAGATDGRLGLASGGIAFDGFGSSGRTATPMVNSRLTTSLFIS